MTGFKELVFLIFVKIFQVQQPIKRVGFFDWSITKMPPKTKIIKLNETQVILTPNLILEKF
jgi:hypothetical protein